ncbi:uncharacterized protein LOC113862317 [Abrus precatorius]|uniref:Uncharacterized protein LOC113862317 n=1 Tax=Abrus precatorius TaxID=3816 RepID=A0A8B8L4J2_ABRPR|nr:uncharacterized protein LOC113862317 [Abrus precatorius]
MPRVSSTPSPSPSASMASTIRAYALPIILFAGAMFYQLFLIPNAFPPSHYDVLQIERYSSVDKVKEAYDKLECKWNSAVEVSDIHEFLKIRYAYELLTNPLWKRDYDIFGIDEQLHIVESARKHYAGKRISELDFPLLRAPSGSIDHSSKVITASDFRSIFPDTKPWLIQLYSSGSERCAQFSKSWNKIASLLDVVANTGTVELGEKELAAYLADRRSTGKPFLRNGIPSFVAIPPGCRAAKCFSRFDGELTVDKVTNWFVTTILDLPQINYYSKELLVPNFLGKTSHHKVKVIFFSKSGERAAPFIRQAAKDYWAYASFAFILWREEESSYWWGAFGVESAPAIVFLKDPGVKPVVHHGSINNSLFLNMMESNKQQELPQLRSVTSMELGCDPRGYSRAGYDTVIWYCAIAVGRPSLELNKMRETMCRVQETLSKHSHVDVSSENQSLAPAIDAFKRRRLTFAWLDGEKQKDYCQFYLGHAASDHTCGQRKGVTDIPRLFVIRYLRNSSAVDSPAQEKTKWTSLLVQDLIDDSDQTGQFVAGYKDAVDVSQITQWLANIIADGDSRDLPFFTLRTPRLVPDETEPIWSKSVQNIPLKNLKQSILGGVSGLSVYLEDPRVGPFLLLGALISLGTTWLRRSQQVQLSKSNQPSSNQSSDSNQPSSKAPSEDEGKQRPRDRVRSRSNKKPPPSMTDFEPSDAYQMPLSDSE